LHGGELVKAAREDMHVLTGSYALDALSQSEREDFERHLHHCPSCEAEVRGLHETAARLAMAQAVRPPVHMEQRVLAATYRTRQLPPLPGERAARKLQRVRASRLLAGLHATGLRATGLRGTGLRGTGLRGTGLRGTGLRGTGLRGTGRRENGLRLPAPRGNSQRGNSRPESGRPNAARPSLARRWTQMPRLVGAVAAASVAVAVGLGVTQISTQHQLNTVQASNAAITRVVQAPDARIETRKANGGGDVTVVFSSARQAAVITTSKLTALPFGRVYQLWVMSTAGARSAGLVSQPDQASQVLAADVRSGDKIGMTVEPSGGTSKPTTPPVLVMPLAT
jgi:anti-sigma-K factor RskA